MLSPALSFFLFSIYGFVGGAEEPYAALRTAALLEAVYEELEAQAGGLAAITTGLNADVPDIDFLSDTLLGTQKWMDVGARADLWGQPREQGTCLTANSKKKKRRDYIFVHPAIVPHISAWRVVDDGTFAVHARVVMTLTVDTQPFKAIKAVSLPANCGNSSRRLL